MIWSVVYYLINKQMGWSVLSFPMLVDIYAEPLISQVMNVYPVSSPTLSIPRARIKSDVIGFDGEIQKSYTIPTPHHLIRPGFVQVTAGLGISNIFALASMSMQGLIMNRRYTLVTEVIIKAASTDGSVEKEIRVPCMLRPDSRDNISGETAIVEFTGHADTADNGKELAIQLSVSFDYDSGKITNAGVFILPDDAAMTYTYVGLTASVKFTAKGSDKGRVITHVEQEMTDLTIDPKFSLGSVN